LFAQKGDYYLKNYEPENQKIDNQNFAIAQDGLGQMCFANRKGVLKFDGNTWNLVNTPSSAHSLIFDSLSNTLFVGCNDDFGYIKPDDKGIETYTSLSKDIPSFGDIFYVEIVNGKTYFLSDKSLFEYDIANSKISRIWNNIKGQHIYNILKLKNSLYMITSENEIFKLEGDKVDSTTLQLPNNELMMFSTELKTGKTVVGTSSSKLYLFNGQNFAKISLQDSAYLIQGELMDGVVMNDSLLLLATLKGGAMVANMQTGKIDSYINYHTGLPDDEILAIGTDRSGGIWIAHEFGFTRLDHSLPLSCYSNYPGLDGNILAANTFQNQLYVATSTGVFVLEEIRDYKEVERVIEVMKKKEELPSLITQNPNEKINEKSKDSEKKDEEGGFLSSIFGKSNNNQRVAQIKDREAKRQEKLLKKEQRKKEKEEKRKKKELEEKDEEETENKNEITQNQETQTVFTKEEVTLEELKAEAAKQQQNQNDKSKKELLTKTKVIPPAGYEVVKETKKELSLQAIRYVYKNVGNIQAKCSQLIPLKDRLLVASNKGIYQIEANQKVSRLNSHPINHLYKSRYADRIYASTGDQKLLSYTLKKSQWIEDAGFLSDITFPVTGILEDKQAHLWLSSTDAVYRLKINRDTLTDIEAVLVENPYFDKIAMVNLAEDMYFVLSNGIYFYDQDTQSLIKAEPLEREISFNGIYLNSQENIIWSFDGKDWDYLSEKVNKNNNFVFLKIFRNLNDIHLDENQRYFWIINENGQLYKFDHLQTAKKLHDYDVFLREVKQLDGNPLALHELKMDQVNSSISFTFSNPDYFDIRHIEYQYKLNGTGGAASKDWTDWNHENVVAFNYLPSGRYSLIVRARNTFGDVTESQPISFVVRPPYWQTPWFYAIEVLIFATLLLLSFRLNRSAHRTSFLSKSLTYLTLILIISLVEIVLQSYIQFTKNPVFDFLFQAVLAILIFPFEKFLSNLIQGNMEKPRVRLEDTSGNNTQ
jgi:ligand-binding sensor domain-containing protein